MSYMKVVEVSAEVHSNQVEITIPYIGPEGRKVQLRVEVEELPEKLGKN